MSYELDPVVGKWYRQVDKEDLFRVVKIDEDEDLIEIQYADGEAAELDSESWFEMDLEPSEAPEDWKSPDEDDEDDEDEDEEDDDWEDEDEDEDDGDDDSYDDR
jgi:hypothetical protein